MDACVVLGGMHGVQVAMVPTEEMMKRCVWFMYMLHPYCKLTFTNILYTYNYIQVHSIHIPIIHTHILVYT